MMFYVSDLPVPMAGKLLFLCFGTLDVTRQNVVFVKPFLTKALKSFTRVNIENI